jgi:sigma-E factor negative regulatory protein RseA
MTDERHSEPPGERQAERDSQLSAMFDDELPGAECELLARRLSRDEALRAQWSRYSIIGAALRAERGVALHDRVAWRVQSTIAQEATYGEGASAETARTPVQVSAAAKASRQRWLRVGYPIAGASIAAGVAAVSIFWLRGAQDPAQSLDSVVAATNSPTSIVLTPELADTTPVAIDTGEPNVYSTPAPSSATSIVPPARLANYVVAHSEYSGPLSRRMALLGIVGAEGGEGGSASPDAAPAAEENDAP